MLTPGTRIGSYEIVDAIGAGGMGEVYRARDTRLRREVAVKILPEIFASDPGRVGPRADLSRSPTLTAHATYAGVFSGPRRTCHRSRRAASRSIGAPTSGRSAASSTRC